MLREILIRDSWILSNENINSVIMGASKKEQIIENVKSINNLSFDSEEGFRIEDIARM